MERFRCLCGELITVQDTPHPEGFHIFQEALLDSLISKLEGLYDQAESAPEFMRAVLLEFSHLQTPGLLHICECARCGRLAVTSYRGEPQVALWFRPEKNLFENVESIAALVEHSRKRVKHGT